MAEEGKNRSPRSRASSVWDERPSGIDRKSLSGMSESVKAILAPLLGGKKRHSEVEVDLGRDSDSASVYETVPTGSTSMSRYSTVEALGATGASGAEGNASGDTGTGTDSTAKINHPRTSYAFETLNRGTGPQALKEKYEDKAGDGPPRTGSPIDPAYARVDNFLPATKPKLKEYDNYLKEAGPQLRARVDSLLADKSHEAGFERRLPGGEELPKLEDIKPIYGEASDMPQPTQDPSLMDRVKDTVTGQLPGHGIYSGKATTDTSNSNRLPSAVRDHLPVQDVGMGSNVHSGTGGGNFDRDTKSEPGKEGSGVPGHNPNEDHVALDGNLSKPT